MTSCSDRKKGLILYSGAIGDCLLTLPLAHCLKQLCRLDDVDYLGPAGYLEFYPQRTCINRVRSIETIPLHYLFQDPKTFMLNEFDRLRTVFAGYEQVVCLLGATDTNFEKNLLFTLHSSHCAELTTLSARPNPGDNRHVSEYYVDTFKRDNQLTLDVEMPQIYVTPLSGDYHIGADLIEQAGMNPDQNIALIHPGSGSVQKCWYIENFMQVASDLLHNDIQTVFLLGPAEQERFSSDDLSRLRQEYPVLDNMSLTQVLQILTQADLFLGNDSGIGHLSAMMGKNTVILFGDSDVRLYQPLGRFVKVLHPCSESFSAANAAAQKKVADVLLEML